MSAAETTAPDAGAPVRHAKRLGINGLNKWFGSVHVVKDLDLDVSPGEFLVLLGPSGCGKTTALRMVAGLEQANSGSIHIGDTDVTTVLPKYRDIAMVFQSYALYPHKTVAENIGFPLKVRGIDKAARDGAVRDAAAQVHMESLLERYPRQLSGGQRQRVALARAIVRRPSIFLMDEPLSNLDAKLRGFMRAELKHMQHELGTTTVYVTHDQIEAMTLAHRVAIMNHGVLQQLGTPREVYNNPANLFVAGFMGSPPMNFVRGRLSDGRFTAPGLDLTVRCDWSGQAVLGFRPEDAEIVDATAGTFHGSVYTAELTGDVTLVTVTLGEDNLAIKMPKEFEADFDIDVGVKLSNDRCFLFNADSGDRLQAEFHDTAVAS